jgi:hypothetical protein
VENLKLEADFKLQGQQKEIEELKTKLGNLSELEVRVASTTAEVEKSRQTKKELQSRVQALELEKSKLAAELASSHSLEASVCRLREQFEAFQESYIRDVEKVLGILPKVQSALSQRQNGSLLQCIKLTLMGGIGGRSEAPGDLKNSCIGRGETERIGMVLDSHEETAAKEGETSRTGPLS